MAPGDPRSLGHRERKSEDAPSSPSFERARQSNCIGGFSRARRQIIMTLMFKLSPWTQLPYVLIGLGHHDDEKARWCGEQALQLYLNAPTTAGACLGEFVVQWWRRVELCPNGFCMGKASSR